MVMNKTLTKWVSELRYKVDVSTTLIIFVEYLKRETSSFFEEDSLMIHIHHSIN